MTESTWNTFTKTATAQSDGDYDERPHVPDGTYHADVVKVGEPYDKPNAVSGEIQTKFAVELQLSGRRLKGETPILPSFITLPPKYLDEGFLSEKSNLFKFMKALGIDLSGNFTVDPPSWVDEGLSCDVVVENNAEDVSWVTKFLLCSCEGDEDEAPAKPAPVAARGRQPAGAKADGWR